MRNALRVIGLVVIFHFGTPAPVFGQASTIVSEREPIVVYDESELNPKKPGYEWTGPILLQDIRVIDGKGSRPQTGQDVLIAEGKIAAVGRTGSLDVPGDTRVIDGDGLTVLPGLIDAHNHVQGGWRGANDNGPRPLTLKWDLLALLYNGVTQTYDIGNISERGADARDLVEAGAWIGPDMKIAGSYFETAPVGAVGANILLTTPDAAYIGGQLDNLKVVFGVEMVKCHSGITSQVLRVLVAEAHSRDMRVVCDLWHNNGSPWIARQTHLDGYAHNVFMAVMPTAEDAAVLADEGTFVITTNVVMDAFARARVREFGVDYVRDNSLIVDVQPPHYIAGHFDGRLEASFENYRGVEQATFADVKSADEIRADGIRRASPPRCW